MLIRNIFRKNPQLRVFYQYDISNPNSFDYAVFNSKYGQNNGLELMLPGPSVQVLYS